MKNLLPQFQEEENKKFYDYFPSPKSTIDFFNARTFLLESHARLIDKIVEMVEEEKVSNAIPCSYCHGEARSDQGGCSSCDGCGFEQGQAETIHNSALSLIQSKLKQI